MQIYEKRVYSVKVGKMPEMLQIERDEVWPLLEAEGFAGNLVGCLVSDTGRLHQLLYLWRFDDDADRRAFWRRLYASEAFIAVAGKIRPLLDTQEVQLLSAAPFGPTL